MTELETIAQICKGQSIHCDKCPFYCKDHCIFKGHPNKWNVTKIKEALESKQA